MEELIKISKEVAASINRLTYVDPITGCSCEINPLVGEQKDGAYLMDKKTYLKAMEVSGVKEIFEKIDFNSFEKITKEESDLKTESK